MQATNGSEAKLGSLLTFAVMLVVMTSPAVASHIDAASWRITIDENPPTEFVAAALERLNYTPPDEYTPGPNFGVGNYDISIYDDLSDEDLAFFRFPDDLDQDSSLMPIWSSSVQGGEICITVWAFAIDDFHAQKLESELRALIAEPRPWLVEWPLDPDYTDATLSYLSIRAGSYPVFVESSLRTYRAPQIWAVHLAIPEPTTIALIIVGAMSLAFSLARHSAQRAS